MPPSSAFNVTYGSKVSFRRLVRLIGLGNLNIQDDLNLPCTHISFRWVCYAPARLNLNVCGVGVGVGANAMHDLITDFVFSDVKFTINVQKYNLDFIIISKTISIFVYIIYSFYLNV